MRSCDPRRAIADTTATALMFDVKLRAISIPQRRSADDLDLVRIFDLADTPQLLAQNFDLARELEFVRRVLIMTAAAARKIRARRRYTIGRRLQYFDQRSVNVVAIFNPGEFAGQYIRYEHHSPRPFGFVGCNSGCDASEPIAAIHPLFDTDFV